MKRMMKFGLITFCTMMMVASCTQKSEYDRLVEKELASNVRQDSLFLGINFSMNSKEFYTHCWELNKQRVFTNGVGNMSVKYALPNQLSFPASMNFYPKFGKDKIFEMPVDFQYNEWALWDKEMSNEVLLEDVRKLLEEWYGGEFIEVESNDGTMKILVKVDGNRRIRLWKHNVSTVRAIFTDLLDLKDGENPS